MDQELGLLDIGQAAAFLGVSEMSLRRWTNAGRLRCFRIGGRRERRFRRADLLAFLEQSGPAEPAAPAQPHLCGLYASPDGRDRLAARFLADGLDRGSLCVLVAPPGVRRRILGWLARLRGPARRGARRPRPLVAEYASSAGAQLALLEAAFARATRAGDISLRAVGDVSGGPWARRQFDEVVAYERGYDRLSRRFPVSTLCLYDARRLSGVQASRLLHLHGDGFRYPVDTLVS